MDVEVSQCQGMRIGAVGPYSSPTIRTPHFKVQIVLHLGMVKLRFDCTSVYITLHLEIVLWQEG